MSSLSYGEVRLCCVRHVADSALEHINFKHLIWKLQIQTQKILPDQKWDVNKPSPLTLDYLDDIYKRRLSYTPCRLVFGSVASSFGERCTGPELLPFSHMNTGIYKGKTSVLGSPQYFLG
jgi:hypothetical protein